MADSLLLTHLIRLSFFNGRILTEFFGVISFEFARTDRNCIYQRKGHFLCHQLATLLQTHLQVLEHDHRSLYRYHPQFP